MNTVEINPGPVPSMPDPEDPPLPSAAGSHYEIIHVETAPPLLPARSVKVVIAALLLGLGALFFGWHHAQAGRAHREEMRPDLPSLHAKAGNL